MKYQPHIDGLRTVAVLPVLIFHLGSPLLPGGYVGVDVFFVISGFLITGILLKDMEVGRYSLLEFYKRRILRILPALAVVLLATFLGSGLIFFETERVETGKSIAAAAGFISNLYFWNDAGYFTAPAETKPLLHTWSLAVEEQFYIVFPPLIFLTFKYARRNLLAIIAALSVASLVGCIVITTIHQPSAFYLLPFRAWELGVGAALAIVAARGPIVQEGAFRHLGPLGLVLTVAPMFLLTSESAFPGWNAIAPVVGAMLLIGWGSGGVVGKLLSSRPFVEVGKISYSLYLWHWPVIVFWKAYSGHDLSVGEMIAVFGVSCLLGAVSTHLIERPFRTPAARSLSAPRVAAAGGAVLVGFACTGIVAAYTNIGAFRTFPDSVTQIAATVEYRSSDDYRAQFRKGTCFIGMDEGTFEAYDRGRCAAPSATKYNVLLIGDSHSAQYWGALQEAMPNANVMQANSSGCRALLDAGGERRCTDMRNWIFDEFLAANRVDMVILGGRWQENEMQLVGSTLEELRKLVNSIVVIGPTVEYDGVFPELLARSKLTGDEFDVRAKRKAGLGRVNDIMRSTVEEHGILYVDALLTICPTEACKLFAPDGIPMHFDYGHLTLSGARYVIDQNLGDIVSAM